MLTASEREMKSVHSGAVNQAYCESCYIYLFSYKPEAFVRSVALICLSEDRIKGFTSCSMVAGRICCYSKCSNVHL